MEIIFMVTNWLAVYIYIPYSWHSWLERLVSQSHKEGGLVAINLLTVSSGMTENTNEDPSASPLGLSWLGHICNKGNEQATFWFLLLLLFTPPNGSWIEFFDSRLDELEFSPPESLVALEADCLGERHIFLRRDDDESRRLSGFCWGKRNV